MASSWKKTRGRQKIDMKIIEKDDEKLVIFTKRQSGIYKKISEITILCGTDILFICFSPAGKPFSFSHPSIDSVVNCLFNNNTLPPIDNTHPLVEAHRKEKINETIECYNEASRQSDATREKQKLLAQ
ncbi:hypothetical protein V6N13_014820 [Hibiscus sabdariffa]|uniref:MADS-box domain-containing protein n=1 Tax=Hibiscus sabdariffa TaxID=183260 RepID=A0ABR2RWU3_9ROSI